MLGHDKKEQEGERSNYLNITDSADPTFKPGLRVKLKYLRLLAHEGHGSGACAERGQRSHGPAQGPSDPTR